VHVRDAARVNREKSNCWLACRLLYGRRATWRLRDEKCGIFRLDVEARFFHASFPESLNMKVLNEGGHSSGVVVHCRFCVHLQGSPIHHVSLQYGWKVSAWASTKTWGEASRWMMGASTKKGNRDPIARLLIVEVGKILATPDVITDKTPLLRTGHNCSRHNPIRRATSAVFA